MLKEKLAVAEKAAKRAAKLKRMQEAFKDNDEVNKVLPSLQLGLMAKIGEMLDVSISKDIGEPESPEKAMTD